MGEVRPRRIEWATVQPAAALLENVIASLKMDGDFERLDRLEVGTEEVAGMTLQVARATLKTGGNE